MATASLQLDRTRVLKTVNPGSKEKLHRVSIRITHLRRQWAVGMKLYATETDFNKALKTGISLSQKQKELRDTLIDNRTKAQSVLDNLKVINIHSFRLHFFSSIDLQTTLTQIDIKTQFEAYIKEMKEDDRILTSEWYTAAMKSLIAFRGNVNLQEIDVEHLKKYSVWMAKKGNSRATTQCYLQKLRSIMNICLGKGTITQKYYPFGKGGYAIGSSMKSKNALYEQGRTKPGNKVTNAKGGQSPHNFNPSFAIDVAFVVNGKVDWNTKWFKLFSVYMVNSQIEWGGGWKFVDYPHYEVKGWKKLIG